MAESRGELSESEHTEMLLLLAGSQLSLPNEEGPGGVHTTHPAPRHAVRQSVDETRLVKWRATEDTAASGVNDSTETPELVSLPPWQAVPETVTAVHGLRRTRRKWSSGGKRYGSSVVR